MSVKVELPSRLRNAVFHGSCQVGAYTYFSGAADVHHTDIGRYCSISQGVIIGPGEHPTNRFTTHPLGWGGGRSRFHGRGYRRLAGLAEPLPPHRRTIVGHDVWLGANTIILQGIVLGHGSIVAAGAVVTKDVPAYAIVGGVPARTVGHRFTTEVSSRLLDLAWWNLNLMACDLTVEAMHDVTAFCDQLDALIADDDAPQLAPETRLLPNRPLRRWLIGGGS